ncbi:unnamed protein product, partial [Arabidopsis halleri]
MKVVTNHFSLLYTQKGPRQSTCTRGQIFLYLFFIIVLFISICYLKINKIPEMNLDRLFFNPRHVETLLSQLTFCKITIILVLFVWS